MLAVVTLLCTPGVPPEEARAAEVPPRSIPSPDGRYFVRNEKRPAPAAAVDTGFFTLSVYQGARRLAQFPTEGYLIGASWSPDGRYVVINNRRTNQGDCLWVLRLSNGGVLKEPVDGPRPRLERQGEAFEQDLVKAVSAVNPQVTYDDLRKDVTFATDWTPAGELKVTTYAYFHRLPDVVFEVEDVYVVQAGQLQRTARTCRQRARRPHQS